MAKIDLFGSISTFNLENNELVFNLNHLTLETIEDLQGFIESQEVETKLSFKIIKKERTLSAKQRKQFWVDFQKIMEALKIPKTVENSKVFYYDVVKKNIFPVKYRSLGDHSYPYIPEMKELLIEEMADIIQRQRDYYGNLDINWSVK